MNERLAAQGQRSFWMPPEDATPEQLAQYEEFIARALVPDDTVTTWVDVADVLPLKWEAIQQHVTQISHENGFLAAGFDAWKDFWSREAYVLRSSRVPATTPETDLFAGL